VAKNAHDLSTAKKPAKPITPTYKGFVKAKEALVSLLSSDKEVYDGEKSDSDIEERVQSSKDDISPYLDESMILSKICSNYATSIYGLSTFSKQKASTKMAQKFNLVADKDNTPTLLNFNLASSPPPDNISPIQRSEMKSGHPKATEEANLKKKGVHGPVGQTNMVDSKHTKHAANTNAKPRRSNHTKAAAKQ
jgi:hypothetical protein